MKFFDLFTLCINNLKRRKLRTMLTVLGVAIGTTSVVIMIALGFGIDELNEKNVAQYGSLTQITVNDNRYTDQPKYLTDEIVSEIKKIPSVTDVYPVLQTQVIIKQGVYELSTNLNGVPKEYIEQIKLTEGGSFPEYDGNDLSMVFGYNVITNFLNTKTKKSWWETDIVPDIDYSAPFFVVFDVDKYRESLNQSEDNPVNPPKKYMLKVCGVEQGTAGNWDEYTTYCYDAYADIDALVKQLKKIFGKNAIPGQPLTKKGKPYKFIAYNSLIVCCENVNVVSDIQQSIIDMGYQAYSNAEWLKQTKQQSRMLQNLLGGIGAVALLVAAIGIANTMMMSIYERTKEIGIMKVLGCDMAEIRNMFLVESGLIGFIGGSIGMAVSTLAAAIVNRSGISEALVQGMGGDVCIIPFWLYFASVGFAILISMLAGLAPSLKAMRLSPLTAIRNE